MTKGNFLNFNKTNGWNQYHSDTSGYSTKGGAAAMGLVLPRGKYVYNDLLNILYLVAFGATYVVYGLCTYTHT